MANLDLEPLDLEPVEKESKLDLEPIEHPQPIVDAPEEQGMISKGIDFAKNLPNSAIDLVPGMKERREAIEAYRQTPEYKNAPSDIPGLTKGQREQSFKESSEAQMNDPAYQAMGLVGESSLLALGKLIPGVGKMLQKGGSRMAADVAGIPAAEEAATQWVRKEGGRWSKQAVPGGKGIGQTAVEEGALPTFGGTEQRIKATESAIDRNYNQLDPLLKNAQQALDPKLEEVVSSVGPLGDKLAKYHYDFQSNLGQTDQAGKIADKLLRENRGNIEKLANIDGNLEALNAFKRDLQKQADRLNAYGPNQNKPAANYLKGMAGVVRQQIEDLANAADPASQMGQQLASANANIQKLMDFKEGVETTKQMTAGPQDVAKSMLGHGMLGAIGYKIAGPAGAVALPATVKTAQVGAELATGQPMSTTAKILAAKGMLKAAKSVDTPIGNITLKSAPVITKTITNPFSQKQFKEQTPEINPTDSTKVASLIYNANDESLKNIANNFKQDPSMHNISNALDKYIKTKDTQDLNVATFLMLQNRNAVKLLTGEK